MDKSKEVGGKIKAITREYSFTRCSKISVENKKGMRQRRSRERKLKTE